MTPRDNSPADLDLEAVKHAHYRWDQGYIDLEAIGKMFKQFPAMLARLQSAPRTGEGPEPEQSPPDLEKAARKAVNAWGLWDDAGEVAPTGSWLDAMADLEDALLAPPPGAKEGPKPAGLEGAIPALLELARNEPHDEVDCPEYDTCRCENIAKLNADFEHVAHLLSRASQPQHQEGSETDEITNNPNVIEAREKWEEGGLQWTREKPTESGAYFIKWTDEIEVTSILVRDGVPLWYDEEDDHWYAFATAPVCWAGPITEPTDPVQGVAKP